MKFEKITDEKFASFEHAKVSNLHRFLGGAATDTPKGRKDLNGGSCQMSWGSDTKGDDGGTTYHDSDISCHD